MRTAAIYARVSSEQQREAHTIASQTAALIELARTLDLDVPKAWIFEDAGYSGATLERPGLERVPSQVTSIQSDTKERVISCLDIHGSRRLPVK